MHYYKFVQFVFLGLIIISFGARGSSSGSGDVKSTSETVGANKVDSTSTIATRTTSYTPLNCSDTAHNYLDKCPSNTSTSFLCSSLPAYCLQCDFNCTCVYGERLNVTCRPKPKVACVTDDNSSSVFSKEMVCQYCYQTAQWQHICTGMGKCNSLGSPRPYYSANCTVKSSVVCLGRRNFLKKLKCNWTAGYRWSTALILSFTLGGFGADRFYLGHWQEGIGKLFSFGGLGVWTIMDVILIAIRYLGPADGSLYI